MEERGQSEFNMAVSYLNRMNALFYIADEAAMSLDAYQWFHSLLAIERELSTEMNKKELDKFETIIRAIHPEVTTWVNEKNRGATVTIDAELYQSLHELEIELRKILKDAGLQNKMMEDAMNALK